MRAISLTPAQCEYLQSADYLSEDLRRMIDTFLNAPLGHEAGVLPLDDETSELFRSEFTERLAQVGFGADYELSSEGAIVEDLIDRFAT